MLQCNGKFFHNLNALTTVLSQNKILYIAIISKPNKHMAICKYHKLDHNSMIQFATVTTP